MITIKITDRSIRMNGHACRKSPDGIDPFPLIKDIVG